jgi:hypothetical protein
MKKSIPEFLEKYDFDVESYENFISNYESKDSLDKYGNLILSANIEEEKIKDVDKFVMKVFVRKKSLKNTQLELFMDTQLSEFADQVATDDNNLDDETLPVVDLSEEIDEEIKSQIDQENILQTQLTELSDILDSEIEKSVQFQEKSSENFAAARDLIISQRISLGEGNVPADFSDQFPFLPLRETEEGGNDTFPFMSS